jgi:hypothetical protein
VPDNLVDGEDSRTKERDDESNGYIFGWIEISIYVIYNVQCEIIRIILPLTGSERLKRSEKVISRMGVAFSAVICPFYVVIALPPANSHGLQYCGLISSSVSSQPVVFKK